MTSRKLNRDHVFQTTEKEMLDRRAAALKLKSKGINMLPRSSPDAVALQDLIKAPCAEEPGRKRHRKVD